MTHAVMKSECIFIDEYILIDWLFGNTNMRRADEIGQVMEIGLGLGHCMGMGKGSHSSTGLP
jgi:hypothetical protein